MTSRISASCSVVRMFSITHPSCDDAPRVPRSDVETLGRVRRGLPYRNRQFINLPVAAPCQDVEVDAKLLAITVDELLRWEGLVVLDIRDVDVRTPNVAAISCWVNPSDSRISRAIMPTWIIILLAWREMWGGPD